MSNIKHRENRILLKARVGRGFVCWLMVAQCVRQYSVSICACSLCTCVESAGQGRWTTGEAK